VSKDSLDDLSSLIKQDLDPADPSARAGSNVRWRSIRLYFAGTALLLPLGAAELLFSRSAAEPWAGLLAPAWAAGIALLCLLCLWRLPRRYGAQAAAALIGLTMVLLVLIAWSRGLGLYSLSLTALALLTALATSMVGLRAGLSLSAIALLGLAGLFWGESSGWAVSAGALQSLSLRGGLQVLLVLSGLAIGIGALRLTETSLREARERNARFRGLLTMAADWYWEMDRDYRFTQFTEDKPGSSGIDLQVRLGKTPWELAHLGLSEEDLDAHRADLESHRPFHRMLAKRRAEDGSTRFVSISGEPRFDAKGNFRGYWGVGRDVTHEVRTEQSIQATESRYRELFRRSPSPLVLHRWGRVLDANPAAMAMFGYTQRSSMIGQDLFSHYEPGDDERARQRAAKIEAMPVGGMMPMAEFRLHTLSRRLRLVQATSVRVEAAAGPATLSFFIDQTEQSRAQEALRRSEGLLSHLVATSPDVITLTDLQTGRYAMVNKTFEQLTGYTSEEVLGRTASDLGLWQDKLDRSRVLDKIRQHGRVVEQAMTFVDKRGRPLSMVMSAAPFAMEGQQYLVINARDVSASERTRLVHQAVLENASIGITLTREQTFVQVNRLVEEMFGWPAGSLIGQPGSVIWRSQEDYLAGGRELGPQLESGQQVETQRLMRRRDGSLFWCRMLARAVDPLHPAVDGTVWILEDITERRQAEAALASAKDEAQAANRAKSAFLANTSHEIRTPLNGLLGLARLLQQPDLEDATQRQYLDQLLASAESLSGLISDILDLAKIEAGRLTLETAPFDLHDMLATLRLTYLALADSRGLSFQLELDAALPVWVSGDAIRTRQILSNFASNAIKFTASGSVVLSAQSLAGDRLRFTLTDTGPGIEHGEIERLFEPFTQADESTTRRFGGTGLGLSICRDLAELMGGSVGVESQPGQGSVFWAELPLPASGAALNSEPRQLPTATDNADLRGLRVLMAEDHPVNMLIAVAQLQQWGLEVSQASDGSQAVEAIFAASSMGKPFDAVLMDLQMPVMSGHEATRQVRQRFTADELPIVALTAAALVSERDEALAAGMNEFLTKPIDAPKLRQTLVRLIGHRDNDQTRT
jgi:PAS domain S-box-containing protein